MMGLGIVVAAASALGFALSTSLQHRSADQTPGHVRGTGGLLAHLARRPAWLIGQFIAVLSFALHAIALRIGALVTIQPVVVSGIVLAIPVGAALNRRIPSLREMVTVALTAIGLAVLLVAARPSAGYATADQVAAWVLIVVATVIAGSALVAGRRSDVPARAAAWWGVAAGVLFGLVAGLVKLAFTQLNEPATSWAAHLGHGWALWLIPVVGLAGVAINQRAYRVARLSASMPILNAVDVIVALLFGVLVFGEIPLHTPLALLAQSIALVCIVIGLSRLSRSDVLDEPQGVEKGATRTVRAAVQRRGARS